MKNELTIDHIEEVVRKYQSARMCEGWKNALVNISYDGCRIKVTRSNLRLLFRLQQGAVFVRYKDFLKYVHAKFGKQCTIYIYKQPCNELESDVLKTIRGII